MIGFLKTNEIYYKENVQLSELSGMNVQGLLPIVAYPNSMSQLANLYIEVVRRNITYDILAGLTNTYLSNGYFRDIVIMTTKVKEKIRENEDRVWVGCGYSLTKISNEFSREGIAGYEGFVGIPGTIGAAAINNSGAFNSSMSKVVLGLQLSFSMVSSIFLPTAFLRQR